jgi:hypothetical protein
MAGVVPLASPVSDRHGKKSVRGVSKGIGVSSSDGGRAQGMAEYRAYTVGLDGHFVGSRILTCSDDVEAIEKARQFVESHEIELWSGDRFVSRLVPKPK